MEMDCHIFKSKKKSGYYIFVEDPDKLATLPHDIAQILGPLEFVMNISLDEETRFALSDAETIISAINQHGFYVQLPPGHIK